MESSKVYGGHQFPEYLYEDALLMLEMTRGGIRDLNEMCKAIQPLSLSDRAKLDVGKLAMRRLQTHGQFGGTWLSDYVPNRLGGFVLEEPTQAPERQKPDCALIGEDGNIFNLMAIASRTLRQNDMADQAKEMCQRIRDGGNGRPHRGDTWRRGGA